MTRRLVFVLLLIVASTPLWADGACSQEAIKQAAAGAQKAQKALLAVKVPEHLGGSVTPVMQKLIREFKDKLAVAVDAQVNCTGIDVNAAELERTLSTLDAERLQPAKSPDKDTARPTDHVYGSNFGVRVSKQQNYPEVLMISVSFGIECGFDSVLLVYERKPDGWRRVVQWQAKDYDEIKDAFGDFFEYALVPGGSPGSWSIAAVHGMPWCTSRFSGFRFDIIAPASGNSPQRPTFHKQEYYIRFDVEPVMKSKPDGFELRVEVQSLDMDTITRPGIYRYRIEGDKVERVQPIAMNGRGFVDEWLQVAWADASRWSDPQNLKQLKAEHERMGHAPGSDYKKSVSLSYGPVRACSDDRNHFQVQEDEETGDPLYFQIKQLDNGYMMMSISSKADPSCKGRDIMPKQQ